MADVELEFYIFVIIVGAIGALGMVASILGDYLENRRIRRIFGLGEVKPSGKERKAE